MNEVSKHSNKSLLASIFSLKMLICVVIGFASGLPLYVIITLVPAYLKVYEIDIRLIGLLSLATFPYTFKFLWAPLVDRFDILKLGRRRSWLVVTQVLLIVGIGLLGMSDPKQSLNYVTALLFMTAFMSATQDVTIDAYRRELLNDNEQGLGNSIHVNAYRVASFIPSSVSLILSDFIDFKWVFIITALFLLPCLIVSFFLKEIEVRGAPRNLKDAVVKPFEEFITRNGLKAALITLLFVFLYKVGDSMAGALATPFYIDLGYTRTVIGVVAKSVGLASSIIGAIIGGILMLKIGINKALWIFGILQIVSTFGFYLLTLQQIETSPNATYLGLVIAFENLSAGLGTAAFVSYIAKSCNLAYTATQFALLSSLSAVPRTFCNAASGYIVAEIGWGYFFIFCCVIALPGMLLLFKLAPFRERG